MTRDPYDPSVAFDDLVDDDIVVHGQGSSFRDRVGDWIERAKQRLRTSLRGDDVRLDDEPSYLAFRVARLEQALRQHMADGHGSAVTVLGAPVPLPCCSNGAIECWQDGSDVVCSVRFEAPDGARVATAAAPIAPAVDDVVGAAWETGVEYPEVHALAGPLAVFVAADRLVSELCGCIVGYLDNPKASRARDYSIAANPYLHGVDVLVSCGGAA
jgi:hypothetical protein